MKTVNNTSKTLRVITALFLLGTSLIFFSFTGTGKKSSKKPVLSGTIHISGTRFLFPLIEKWAAEFKKANPGVNFIIGQGAGAKDIDASAAPVKRKDSAKGVYTVVSRFALVPITNAKNPALPELARKGLSKEDFLKIYFKGDHQTSGFNVNANQVVPIHVYSRGACASATFTNHFDKQIKDLDNVGGKIDDDKVLLESVLKDSLGIAYNNLGFVYDLKTRNQKNGIRVIPIDLNNNGRIDSGEDFYRSLDNVLNRLEKSSLELPPTGDLTFIYKDDRPEIREFVKWILEKGQQYNNELGFLALQKKTQ